MSKDGRDMASLIWMINSHLNRTALYWFVNFNHIWLIKHKTYSFCAIKTHHTANQSLIPGGFAELCRSSLLCILPKIIYVKSNLSHFFCNRALLISYLDYAALVDNGFSRWSSPGPVWLFTHRWCVLHLGVEKWIRWKRLVTNSVVSEIVINIKERNCDPIFVCNILGYFALQYKKPTF